ncbi:MAG: hypothetical protein IJ087_20615, partial [Eggerthellaceae bacterium]|nr:hypothetical protein [Eggerthellaceae bacterium]
MDATRKTALKAGPYYMAIGGETIEVPAEDITATRKEGAGRLKRGGRGFVDLAIFQKPGLTTDPLKRKVLWTHPEDIDGDPIAESVKCVEAQADYLMGLPEGCRPTMIVYHVEPELTEHGVAEAFVAVDEDFDDETFDNLYEGPGYPAYKVPEYDDYIPEFLRTPPLRELRGDAAASAQQSEDETARSPEGREGMDADPRWRFVDRAMKPTWPCVMNPDRDYRKKGGQYVETDAHRIYREAVSLARELAGVSEPGALPEFAFFLEALACRLASIEAGEGMAADLGRRIPYFRYGKFGAEEYEDRVPTIAEVLACLDSVAGRRRFSEDHSEAYARESRDKVVAAIKEAVRNPGHIELGNLASKLEWECLDCLVDGMGAEALCLAKALLLVDKARSDIGDKSRLNDIADAHGMLAWAYELQGSWHHALEEHRLALAGYRSCKADGGWLYDENVADHAYCVAFLTSN